MSVTAIRMTATKRTVHITTPKRSAQYEAERQAEEAEARRRDQAELRREHEEWTRQEYLEARQCEHEYYERLVEEAEIEAAVVEAQGDGP